MPKENPLLAQAAADVPQESSPAPEETPQAASADTSPAPESGNTSGDHGTDEEKPNGRTLDNVSGEFNRKMSDMRSELSSGLAEMKGMIAGMASQPAAQTQAAPDVNTMSVSQLEALASNVPEAQKEAYDNLLATRRSTEAVTRQVDERIATHTFNQQRAVANKEAFDLYPELKDPMSAVRQATNRILNESGMSAQNNPYALAHAAKAAGTELGLKPSTLQRNAYGAPVGGGTAPAPQGDAKASSISSKKLDTIADKLSGAMPGGKFTAEQRKRIKANSAMYNDNKHLFIKQ